MDGNCRIGELARRAGVLAETVRYYEGLGLLRKPPRSAGNYRLYARADLDRLILIRHCRSLDMSIGEIRQLLRVHDRPDADCSDANAVIDAHIRHVGERVSELQRLKRQLVALRKRCRTASRGSDCAILKRLSSGRPRHTNRATGGHKVRGIHAG